MHLAHTCYRKRIKHVVLALRHSTPSLHGRQMAEVQERACGSLPTREECSLAKLYLNPVTSSPVMS